MSNSGEGHRRFHTCNSGFEERSAEAVLGRKDQRLGREAYFDPPVSHTNGGFHQLFRYRRQLIVRYVMRRQEKYWRCIKRARVSGIVLRTKHLSTMRNEMLSSN